MTTTQHSIGSRTVSWWPVHQYLERTRQAHGSPTLPAPGTLAWCEMDDADPLKLLALAVDDEHLVLFREMRQEALADASKTVAAAADWPAVARELQQLDAARKAGTRIPRSKDAA